MQSNEDVRICVVGLGYVGLPLAILLAKQFRTFGFDVNSKKISQLHSGIDAMGEVSSAAISSSTITFSDNPSIISKANFIIVSVPTPINDSKMPDITLLQKASSMVGSHLQPGSTVVFESTVYPGCTEEDCVPLIERASGLVFNKDFFVGYSPERVNPGDKTHTIDKIYKIVSGSTPETCDLLEIVYGAITKIHKAPNIKTAEAAKVIENCQRDLNIALVNELSLIFERMGIRTSDVIEAAGTKWNFHKYLPGLVGGHCIGVDPYYLTYKAEKLGYRSQVILAGRRINDDMASFVAQRIVKKMIQSGMTIQGARVLVLGLTFKENVRDVRNSKIFDLIKELREYEIEVLIHDALLTDDELAHETDMKMSSLSDVSNVDVVVLGSPHEAYTQHDISYYGKFMKNKALFFDLKGVYKGTDSKFSYFTL